MLHLSVFLIGKCKLRAMHRSILTLLNVIGFTIAFLGVSGYNYIRRQMKQEVEQPPESANDSEEAEAFLNRNENSQKSESDV